MMSTKVAELTVDELKELIETTIEQKLLEMFGDPDQGLQLREEITARLLRSLEAAQRGERGTSAQDVAAQLGLEW
jgi:hypothetical protein